MKQFSAALQLLIGCVTSKERVPIDQELKNLDQIKQLRLQMKDLQKSPHKAYKKEQNLKAMIKSFQDRVESIRKLLP